MTGRVRCGGQKEPLAPMSTVKPFTTPAGSMRPLIRLSYNSNDTTVQTTLLHKLKISGNKESKLTTFAVNQFTPDTLDNAFAVIFLYYF